MKKILCGSVVFALGVIVNAVEIDQPTPAGKAATSQSNSLQEQRWQDGVTVQLLVELRDGSSIMGEPKLQDLSVQTALGKLNIPFCTIESILFKEGQTAVIIQCQNGDRLQGTIKARQIQLKTSFGDIALPVLQVVRVSANGINGCWGRIFDGSGGISIPGSGILYDDKKKSRINSLPQPIRSCTWLFWIRTKQTSAATIISKDISGGGVKDFYLAMNDMYPPAPSKLSWVEGTSSVDFKWRSAISIDDGEWHHVAIIRNFDDLTLQYCIDGKMESPGRNSLMWEVANEQPLTIGTAENSNFEGDLCDVRFYRQALKHEQIVDAMKGRFPRVDCLVVSMGKRMNLPKAAGDRGTSE